jgi:predicted enzyme related to lactoylglutathione lyase
MLRDSKFVYLFIYVGDLEASREFYEKKVGLRVLEEDAGAVKYDAGEIILALNRANDYGIIVEPRPDDSSMIVFHVDDIDAMRSALEGRGVKFSGATERYDIGATAVFYDLDGHCLCLYEPSEEALTWPSADKIRAILGADGRGAAPAAAPRGSSTADGGGLSLAGRKMLYLFLFVRDVAESFDFYHNKLGLQVLEESDEVGVVKYDCGGVILATHLVESEGNAKASAEDLARAKGIAPVFHVPDIEAAHRSLASAGVEFSGGVRRSEIGAVALFTDPSGHVFYLYEPSEQALGWASGSKVRQVVAQRL